ncbi:MAG: NUMOD4 domain-containing protein [Bacteroidota bacterium]|nr:NUMOD4 domain-containing protein [Bacteroidota bacterium]MDQ6889669.1 NUMOD4 domain-containing protein [Bacteroidota bacterium]
MIKKINSEVWKQLQFKGWKLLRKKYAVSSHGRVASYSDDVLADGKLLEGSLTSGYKTLNLHINNSNGTIYFHREVAKLFNKKTSPKEKFVIHLNHNKVDNNYKNLKWSTQKDVSAHQQSSPHKIAYKKVQALRTKGLKLDAKKVKAIKAIIESPKRKLTYKQIAEKYEVSEMTIYRIKSGENWGNV